MRSSSSSPSPSPTNSTAPAPSAKLTASPSRSRRTRASGSHSRAQSTVCTASWIRSMGVSDRVQTIQELLTVVGLTGFEPATPGGFGPFRSLTGCPACPDGTRTEVWAAPSRSRSVVNERCSMPFGARAERTGWASGRWLGDPRATIDRLGEVHPPLKTRASADQFAGADARLDGLRDPAG